MKKYFIVYKFDDARKICGNISNFVDECKANEDQVFFFLQDMRDKMPNEQAWKHIAEEKISQCDCVLYVRLRNDTRTEEQFKNITYELECAEKYHKRIVCVEIDDVGSHDLQTSYCPHILYMKDYLDQMRPKYAVINGFDRKAIEAAAFPPDIESELFNNRNGNDVDSCLLLEEFKIMLDTSEKMMDRRQGTNNFYTTLCSAMVTAMVAMFATNASYLMLCIVSLILSAVLTVLCANWRKTLYSYGKSNEAKFDVLNAIEKKLPAAIFDAEWQQGKRLNYTSYSKREMIIPRVFQIMFSIFAIVAFLCGVLIAVGVISA